MPIRSPRMPATSRLRRCRHVDLAKADRAFCDERRRIRQEPHDCRAPSGFCPIPNSPTIARISPRSRSRSRSATASKRPRLRSQADREIAHGEEQPIAARYRRTGSREKSFKAFSRKIRRLSSAREKGEMIEGVSQRLPVCAEALDVRHVGTPDERCRVRMRRRADGSGPRIWSKDSRAGHPMRSGRATRRTPAPSARAGSITSGSATLSSASA